MLELLTKAYHDWRRNVLPSSINDAQWRYESLQAHLLAVQHSVRDLEKQMTHRFPHTVATPEQQDAIRAVLRLLEPKSAADRRKIRVGSAGDGGYVQLDDLGGVKHALSFGICDDDSWDLAMAEAGVPVEQFDHSVAQAPSSHPLLRFHRKMITPDAAPDCATLPDLVAQHSGSGGPDLFLKIDIEGCEWDVFDAASDAVLGRFTQIVCELHDLTQLTDPGFRARAERVLVKLTRLFAPVHVHANNAAPLGNVANVPVPDVLEVTFANRGGYRFADSAELFPTALDAPNAPQLPDIWLGSFRF